MVIGSNFQIFTFKISHVVVYTGDLAIDLRSLTPAKARAMVKFCRATVAFSDSVAPAGYGVSDFNLLYEEGIADQENRWPIGQNADNLRLQRNPLTERRSRNFANEFQVAPL